MLLILAVAAFVTTGFMARSAFRTAAQIGMGLLVALGLIGQIQLTFQADRARAQATELETFAQRTVTLTLRKATLSVALPLTAGQALCLYQNQEQPVDLFDGTRTLTVKDLTEYGGKLSGAFQPRHVDTRTYHCPERATMQVSAAQLTAVKRMVDERSTRPEAQAERPTTGTGAYTEAAAIPKAAPRVHTVTLYDDGEEYLNFRVSTGIARCVLAAAKDEEDTNPLLITDRDRQVTVDLTAAQGRISYDRDDRDEAFPLCKGPVVLRVPSGEMTKIMNALESHEDVLLPGMRRLSPQEIDAAIPR